jgi:hypothetical protein
MRLASKLLNETSMTSDRCVRVPETSMNAQTMNAEPETGLIIAVDADGLVESNAATVAPEMIARARAILRAMKIQTTRRSSLDPR